MGGNSIISYALKDRVIIWMFHLNFRNLIQLFLFMQDFYFCFYKSTTLKKLQKRVIYTQSAAYSLHKQNKINVDRNDKC